MSEHAAALPVRPNGDPSSTHADALVEAGRLSALGELLRGFAHEINNPLFGMLGLVELLLTEIEPGTKAHERLTLVQQSGHEIKRITHTLLDFARAEPQAVGVVALQEVAEGAVELLRCTSAGKTIEFRERYPNEPLRVAGQPARLSQIFLSVSSCEPANL